MAAVEGAKNVSSVCFLRDLADGPGCFDPCLSVSPLEYA